MPGTEGPYLAHISSWSSVDYLIACLFAVEAFGVVLLRYRSSGRLRWLALIVILALGVWAALLGQYASAAYQSLMGGPCPACRSWPPALQQVWHVQVVDAYNRVQLQSLFLLAACLVLLSVVLWLRRRPAGVTRQVVSDA